MIKSYPTNKIEKVACTFVHKGEKTTCYAKDPNIFTNGFWVSGAQLGDKYKGKLIWITPTMIDSIEMDIEDQCVFKEVDNDTKKE